MGPWYLIGALLLLSARVGDSTNKIIIPQQIGSGSILHNGNAVNGGASSMHHHIPKTSIASNAANNKGTVLSGNGVIVAGGSIGPSSSLNTITEEPEFTEYIENVTVPAGRNIKLACSVKNLGSYKIQIRDAVMCLCVLVFLGILQTIYILSMLNVARLHSHCHDVFTVESPVEFPLLHSF
ncbi:uncharacterized protein LOC142224432 [Haematobia irritans]|uniref:uncharacterized protein LOC142224432 n=1 Tax=Haematobia irritans TaxID=7368 RepID=UPI003F509590